MKILYVCHRFPYPPKRGGKIRPFNMIRHLSTQGHQVTVASLARSPDEAVEGEGIREYCERYIVETVSALSANLRMVLRLLSLQPSSMGYFYSPQLEKRIDEAVKNTKFDLIFVHCSSVAQYVEHVKGIPKILDFGDMDSQKWLIYSKFKPFPLSAGYLLEGTKLEKEERRLTGAFDMCTCTTKAELETLEKFSSGTPTGWFPNGVNTEYFHRSDQAYEKHTISFVGRMDYFPNQQCMFEFCQHTLPLIKEKIPDIQLIIIGANPSAQVLKLAELDGVTVTGSVDDVRPYVHASQVNIAPLSIARGTQNKILECMAMGVPVICSTIAAGGVDAVPGEHLLTADTPAGYCDAIVSVINNKKKRDQLASAGRERVLTHHNWDSSMIRMESIIDDCINRFQNT